MCLKLVRRVLVERRPSARRGPGCRRSMILSTLRRALLALALASLACGGEGAREVVHPLAEELLSNSDSVQLRLLTSSDTPTAGLRGALSTFDSTRAIGVLGGTDSTDYLFGELVDAEVDRDGKVLLLDAQFGHLRIFSPDLKPVQVLGKLGKGPGEFVGPKTLIWLSPDEIGVFDPKAARIERFRNNGVNYEPSGTLNLYSMPITYETCGADGRVFAQGIRLSIEGKAVTRTSMRQVDWRQAVVSMAGFVHEFGATGEVLRSFSVPYEGMSNITLANYYTEAGGIACVPGRVWVAYGQLGEIHALTDSGELLWIAKVSDLRNPGHVFRYSARGQSLPGSGAINVDMRAGNYSIEWIDRISLLSKRVLAADVLVRHIGDPSDQYPVSYKHRTYLLDARDGTQLGAFSKAHWILGGNHGKAVLYREDPFPQVAVVSLER